MDYFKELYIFVEGDDDKFLFDKVIKSIFKAKYGNKIHLIKYREKKTEKICFQINSLKTNNDDYIFVADINKSPCKTRRKSELRTIYFSEDEKTSPLEVDKILLAVKKIEGWYLAGLDNSTCAILGITPFDNTDDFGKGQFKEHTPEHFLHARKDFLAEIVKYYSIETAKSKNQSFRYFTTSFLNKHNLLS